MSAPTRLLIIDPHELMRAGIRLACESKPNLEIIGEADDAQSGRVIAEEKRPDVIILELPRCDEPDLQLVHHLHAEFPESRILVFTAVDGPDVASSVLRAGAAGYLIKIASLDEIAVAIQCVHVGRTFVSHTCPPRATKGLPTANIGQGLQPQVGVDSSTKYSSADLNFVSDHAPLRSLGMQSDGTIAVTHRSSSVAPKSSTLSQRESEVLNLLADGLTNKQAAEKMFLSVKTVETYRARIMKKHGLRDRSDLVRFARQERVEELNESR